MKERNRFRWLLLALILIGWLAGLPQLLRRAEIESAQKRVELVMSWQDAELLASAAAEPAEAWLAGLRDAGLRRLLLTEAELDDPEIAAAVAAAGLETAQIGGVPRGGMYLFAQRYERPDGAGYGGALPGGEDGLSAEAVMAGLTARGCTLCLVENETQTGVLVPETWTEAGWSLQDWPGPSVKCERLYDAYRARWQVLGYDGAQEIVNLCFRAVVDRGMTVLWMTPFLTQEHAVVADLAVYQSAFRSLGARLAPAGYAYGAAAAVPLLTLPPFTLFLLGLCVFALAVLLLMRMFPHGRLWVFALLMILGCAESSAGARLAPALQRPALALLAALVFPAASVVLLGERLRRARPGRRAVCRYLVTAVLTAGPSLAGGLLIGAVLGTSDYLLILRLFRGVKLSQLAVYGFSLLWLAAVLLHRPGSSLRADARALFRENSRHWRGKLLLLLLAFAAVCAVAVLRSGDRMLAASVPEQRFRNWLETVLLCRPRTKEFLIGYPCLALAVAFASRGKKLPAWVCGVLASVACVSVVNTFCHLRAHLAVSLVRTALGFLLGVLPGAVLLAALELLWRPRPADEA